MKRSDQYNYFKSSPGNNGGGSKKDKLKKIWKWTKVGIYTFMGGITLTGCVQSFVIKSSSTVGAGIEFYNSSSEIAPYVNAYKIIDHKDEKGNITKQTIAPTTYGNYLASIDEIEQIKKNIQSFISNNQSDIKVEVSDLYGTYGGYSSALKFTNNQDEIISNTNNIKQIPADDALSLTVGTKTPNNKEILFMSSGILDLLKNNHNINYQAVNQWESIPLLVPKNGESLYQAFETTTSSSSTYELVNVSSNGSYVTKDTNWDGIDDSNTWKVITDENRLNKMKFSLVEATPVNLSVDQNNMYSSEAYARDFLQSMANVQIQFAQYDDFFKFLDTNLNSDSLASEKFNALSTITSKFMPYISNPPVYNNGTDLKTSNYSIDPTKLMSIEQKNSFIAYQSEMNLLLTSHGFEIVQSSKDESNNQFVFMPNNSNKLNFILGGSPEAQKPITSWGEAWGLGPFYGLIIWPLAYIINGLTGAMPSMNGWQAIIAIILAVILTRFIALLFTYKSGFAQTKQAALAPKKAKIDAKYADYKGNRQMEQRKRQEIQDLYKKNNISMSTSLLGTLITMPIFLAMWRVIQGNAEIKATVWYGVIDFSATSWREIMNGQWIYLPLIIVTMIVQVSSTYLPRYLSKKTVRTKLSESEKVQMKKSNRTQNIMMIVFVIFAVIFEAGVQIYWIASGLWQIGQTLGTHYIQKTKLFKQKLYKYV